MTEKSVIDKLKKAALPAELAMKYHPFYQGKIQVIPKCVVRSFDDFSIWYTPGVAAPCKEIEKFPEKVFEYTNKGNMVAVVSDGTRVLGLGNIGPYGALPVMEGKALLYKYLGGVDAFPIVLATTNYDDIIKAVKWIEPSFGGINLEDIEKPKCFDILDKLRGEMNIPVWHDDQQGTATVVTASLINALKIVAKKIGEITVSMIGAGAANIAIARLLIKAGVKPGNIYMVDTKGILHPERDDIDELMLKNRLKYEFSIKSNKERRTGGAPEAMKGADVCIAMSTPGPGTVKKEWVASMANDAIMFACANPTPEIWPWEAEAAGAKIVATGRSDFPNQVNNSLGFPGIFRGTLDVRARTITDEMCIAAATELAKVAEEKELKVDYIIPNMDEWEVFPREAVAVAMKAQEQGVSRIKQSRDELFEKIYSRIKIAREELKLLMQNGYIAPPPP